MAAHVLIDENYVGETEAETKAIQKIVHGVKYDAGRSLTGLRGSLKWERLPDNYAFDGSDKAYLRGRNVKVPESMVGGGTASVEAHTRDNKLFKIYLVA